MLDDKSMGTSIGVVGSGRSIYVLSLFVLNIGLARAMGPELMGAFQQVFMFSALFSIMTLGIPETIYYFLPRITKSEAPGFLAQTLIMLGINGVVVVAVIGLGADFLAGIQGNPAIAGNLRIFALYGALIISSSFADPIFITFKKIRYTFILSSLHGAFFIGLTAWRYLTGVDQRMLFIAMAAFGVVKLALALVFLMRMRPLIGPVSLSKGRTMVLLQLSFALPIALSNTIDIISTWLDKFVVSIVFGPETLGIFYVGAIEVPLVGVLLSSTYSVLSPTLNQMHHEERIGDFATLVNKSIRFTAKLVWPLFVYMGVFADHLVPLVFKDAYEASVTPFRIYLLMLPLRVALYGLIVIAVGKPRTVLNTAAFILALNLVLNLVFVKLMGFIGPAVATVLTTYIHVGILLGVIVRSIDVRISELIPFRILLDIGMMSVIAGMLSYFLTWNFMTHSKVISYTVFIFFGAYFFLGWTAGLFRMPSFRQ